ncbi:MAG: DUF2795 domain-containing protein [Methylococcaceae bacterium]|nr:DUF2795 domain-containing protein [Prolixibacteraceae bacterium]
MPKNRFSPIEVQQFLKGMSYPASKEDLVNHARRNRASDGIISMLNGMRTSSFNGPTDVNDALSD